MIREPVWCAGGAGALGSLSRKRAGLALGALALVLAGCGSGNGGTLLSTSSAREDAGAPLDESGEPEAPTDPDASAEPDASTQPPRPEPPSIEEQAARALGGPPRTDVVALGVSELLQTHCGGCHGVGQRAAFPGGLDLGALIASGLIVPGSSATSPLVQNLQHDVSPRLTAGDIALITQRIDQMRSEPPPECTPLPFLSIDGVYAAMLADVNARPEAERPFLRYFGVGYASNAGVCGARLDEQRHALFKLVNALSMGSEIRRPVAVDAEQRVYRIDVRDYGWERALDLDDDGTPDYPDAWSAIVGVAGTGALELSGPEASALASATGTRVPFLPVNTFVSTASVNDLYYALVGIGADIHVTLSERGIDLVVALDERTARRAGFSLEGSTEVLVSRVPLPPTSQADYWLAEVHSGVRSESIYSDPLDIGDGDSSQSIFRLPNGLMAFSANARDGSRLDTLPRACLDNCAEPAQDVAIACHGCHAGGLLPLRDTIRDYAAANLREFDSETFAGIQALFPGTEVLSAHIAEDNARYLVALDQVGVPRDAPDPISRVYLQFSTDPIDLGRAAAELGVRPGALRQRLDELPELAPLREPAGTVPRPALAAASARALCILRTRNRPVTCP